MATPFTGTVWTITDSSGAPINGAKIYTYAAGTLTAKAAYTTSALSVATSNPIITAPDGSAQFFLGPGAYRIRVFDATDVELPAYACDNMIDGQELLRADLASTSDVANGAGQIGFNWALAYAANTAGYGIRSASNAHNVLRWIAPSLWADILNGTSTTDVSTQVQTAIDAISTNGGGSLFVPGKLLCNTPLLLEDNVRLDGMGFGISRIVKDSTTTLAVTVTAGALTVYAGASLPASINAVVVLTGTSGRYRGGISNISIESTLATPGNYETQKAEFGIVSIGSVSDSDFSNVQVLHCQYAAIFPVLFASKVNRCKYETCLRGFAVDNGTSVDYISNYANNCRDWGHYIRDMKYSQIVSNACDYLNDPAKYPTRTRLCNAYRWESLLACTVTSNGDENTWGRSHYFDAFDHSTFENNCTISLGSDYTGASQIAWLYSTNIMRGSKVRNNFGYGVKAGGLTYGGANAANHHNVYFEGQTFVQEIDFGANTMRATRTGTIAEAGWGNNVPTTWTNASKGGGLIYTHSPTLEAQTMGDLSVSYGADNKHYIEQQGNLLHLWGCFHVTPTYTTATGLVIINGFPTVGAASAALQVPGVSGGSGLAAKLGWFEFATGATGGVGRTDGDGNFVITDIPTATAVKIFYNGYYSTL